MTAKANVDGKEMVYVGWVEDNNPSQPSQAELVNEYENHDEKQ